MSLWDQLPGSAQNGGALSELENVLNDVDDDGTPDTVTDDDGTWKSWTKTYSAQDGLSLLGFGGEAGSGSTTPIEFLDPNITIEVGLHQAGGADDGGWRVTLTSPIVAIHAPFLTPAMYDVANARLTQDTSTKNVSFIVPALKLRLKQLAGASVDFKVLSAATTSTQVDDVYDLVRMDPPYALIGPSDAVGFGFRSAVLDLSGVAGPSGVPAGARVMPDDWQGLYLPEVRLFVQPNGLDGLAVTAAAKDLWIGIGASAGVTGVFEAEVVNALKLSVSAHVLNQTGGYVPVSINDDGSDDLSGTATVPADCTLFIDTHGGSGANSVTITPGGAAAVIGTRASIHTDAGGQTITVTVNDAAAGLTKHLTLHFTLDTSAAGGSGGSAKAYGVTPTGTNTQFHLFLDSSDPVRVGVRETLPVGATFAWTSSSVPITGPTNEASVTLDASALTAGNPLRSDLTLTISGAPSVVSDCFFAFDHPKPAEMPGTNVNWALNPANTKDSKSPSHTQQASSRSYKEAAADLAQTIPLSTALTVDGYASWENEQDQYNLDLSNRRRDALIAILHDAGFTAVTATSTPGQGFGSANAHAGTAPRPGADTVPEEGDGFWWLARAWAQPGPGQTVTGTFTADETDWAGDVQQQDQTPQKPPQPSCFHRIGVRVELLRSTFIRAEVWGEFDLSGAADQSAPGLGLTDQQHQDNPADGIVDFLVRLRISEDREAWEVDAEFKAHDKDKDGLYQRKRGDGIPDLVLDAVGALAILAPLTAAVSSLSPAGGAVVALGEMVLGGAGLISTQQLTLYGGSLVVSDGIVSADGSTGDAAAGYKVSVFFDVETKFAFDLKIIRTADGKFMSTRYKAIGVAAEWGAASDPDFKPLAVFDPSKGYTIDAPDGSLTAVSPLDEILRIFGFKVSHDNPFFVEVQFGLGIELGIITIDTATVRADFHGSGAPDISISRLSATLDVPNVLHGTGYVSITDQQISGGFDVQVTSVNIRIAATLTIHPDPDGGPAIGILFGAEVDFPAPILLGSSGLGIYGFLGGMGINFARSYDETAELPALDWAMTHLRQNDLFTDQAWHYDKDNYSFGAGIVLGTADGGFTLHLKGVLLISVPGPDITLLAKADIISAGLPSVTGDTTATIVAVIDVDFGRGTILIALRVQYDVGGLLSVTIPVTAFFDTNTNGHWYVELGSYEHPATVKVLDAFTGSGYLEVHGDGIHLPTQPPLGADGLAFATGFHFDAVLMGSKAIGLYLECAAGFDAILAPDPLYIGGIIYVSGELRLWIIGISASAKLVVIYQGKDDSLYVHGEVHGKVDLFFFSIEGSVELTIGTDPGDPPPTVQPLVTGVEFVARTIQVMVEGSADLDTGKPVDGILSKAVENDASALPVVPIDAIPVLSFLTPAKTDAANILGGVLGSYAGAPSNPWLQIGDHWWRYEVTAVRLTGGALIPPLTPGDSAASVWWVQQPDAGQGIQLQLALLDWIPDPHPSAVPYGESLTKTVDHRWGLLCAKAADSAPVLWTFDEQPLGASASGWHLTGIPWPDDPGTVRSSAPRTQLFVHELWRIAPAIDQLQGTGPALVIGDAVPCFNRARLDGVKAVSAWGQNQPVGLSTHAALDGTAALDALDAHLAAGGTLQDFPAAFQATAWKPSTVSAFARAAASTTRLTPMTAAAGAAGAARAVAVPDAGCFGEVLRSPQHDLTEPAPGRSPEIVEAVKQAWAAASFTPDALKDAVALDAGTRLGDDTFEDVGVLLLLPRIGLEYGLVVSSRDAEGNEVASHRVSQADIVSSSNPIPAHWLDPNGPWADPVSRAGYLGARLAQAGGLLFAYVHLDKLDGKVARVVVGWKRNDVKLPVMPPFYVVAAQAVLLSEVEGHSWDIETLNSDQQALDTALTQPAGSEPLLTPGQTYHVEIDWTAAWISAAAHPGQPAPGDTPDDSTSTTQSFGFVTEPVATKPSDVATDLSPWVLGTVPSKNETGLFTHAGVSLTFSSQRVATLFDAYGLELYAVVHAASGIHPRLADQPDVSVPQVPIGGDSPYATIGEVFGVTTAWQEAAENTATQAGCLDEDNFNHDEFTMTLPYVFEPLTEYLLDVHARLKGDTGAGDIVYRVPFKTGRFSDEADFAAFVGPAPAEGRGVLTPAALGTLHDQVTGTDLDQAFESAGLGAPQVPGFPRLQVLWSTDATPQPVAVVIESSEELVRARLAPQQATPTPNPDPSHHYWKISPYEWLEVAASVTPPLGGELPAAPVDRVAVGPGGTRVIVFLGSSARGTRLKLDLVSTPLPGGTSTRTPLLSVGLLAAPWEDED
ncbi:hypothetical protein [Gryllotalpicola protaetiae]|uniref:Uncharacterized protein n=1 Tax=Gryllotalpicola protaetiae TaxID=2419771 RepID=A0A387BQJ8_9MICO|nr:hypothetical protein [Gryllotalpicola protaetiae]AYG03369.1 hypothetical protein D7I44_07375 [Gryllotalpicola protaetiae]